MSYNRLVSKIIKIGNKKIGYGYPCFIIAEAGVNHNQSLDLALKLVDIAAEAGADAVKFQTFKAEDVVTEKGEMTSYQKANLSKDMNQRMMLKRLELPEDFYRPIINRCREKNILFMSTPHGGKKSVDFLEELGVKVYKIGSGDLTNYILLDRVAKTGKPVILSSGMATLDEVKDAVEFVKSRGNDQTAVLHCTTNYPCQPHEVNLLAMQTMMEELDVPVGYSDHTQESQVAIMAATLGMAVYECHFTLDKTLPGPDHIASCEPDELRRRIEAIRKARVILGKAEKKPNKSELSMIAFVRKSLVATRKLPSSHSINDEDMEAKRPGDGVSPTQYEKFLGKRLQRALKADQQITFADIEDE